MLSITERMMDSADKVALVTGGASGIGPGICKELLQNKFKVIHFSCVGIKSMFIFDIYHVIFKIMHFQISVYFVVIFTDYRVTNLVRVGT